MHKDRKLLAFSIENDSILNVKVNQKEKEHLPIFYGENIMQWLKNRSIPATRIGLSKKISGLNTFDFMLHNLGLSLTDPYWLNPVGSGYTWSCVNLYKNNFRDTMSLDLTDNTNYILLDANLLDINVTSFYSKETKLLSQVKNRGWIKNIHFILIAFISCSYLEEI